jgi:hypothetical protein
MTVFVSMATGLQTVNDGRTHLGWSQAEFQVFVRSLFLRNEGAGRTHESLGRGVSPRKGSAVRPGPGGQNPRLRRIRMTAAPTSSARKMPIPTISSRVATFSAPGGAGPELAPPLPGSRQVGPGPAVPWQLPHPSSQKRVSLTGRRAGTGWPGRGGRARDPPRQYGPATRPAVRGPGSRGS